MTIQSLAIALTDPVEASTSAWDELRTAAKQRPDHQALTTLYEPADQLSFLLPEKLKHFSTPDHFTWTYAQLVAGAEALATHFRKHGLKAGDRAAVFMLNGVDNVICMLACLRIGVTWATANPAFTKDKTHAIHVLETVHPQAVLVSSYEQASQLQAHGFPSGSKDDHTKFRLVCTQEKSPENFHWTTLRDLAQAHALDPASYENALAATVPEVPLQLVMFTSGTTNLPKACPHTAKMIRQILHVAKDYFGIHGNTRQLVPTPLFHGLGAWVCLFVIHRGGTICLTHKQFDPVSCLRSLGELKCTAFALAPSMVFSMTAQPGFNPGAYSHVETILLGSDYVSKHVVQLVKDKFRPQTVLNVWGMTEGTGCLLPPFKQPLVWDGELSYCGYVVPGGNIRICDIETGQAVRRGEVGELQMSGPTVIEGYFKNGTIFQNDCFCQDGDRTWFRTGDAALMKETGEVFIQSRYKDMIIRGGENMSPGYIENCIDGIDGVKAQVVGVADAVMGEYPVAVIEVSAQVDTAALKMQVQKRVEENLGVNFRPSKVYTVQDLGFDAFPKTPNGKLSKQILRERLAKMTEDQEKDTHSDTSTTKNVVKIWQQLIGAGDEVVGAKTSLVDLVDSLLIIRFSYDVEKKLGSRITFAEVVENDTPEKQAAILDKSSPRSDKSEQSDIKAFIAASSRGEDDDFPSKRREATLKRHVENLGLTWEDDVEDVFQPQDSTRIFWASALRSNSSNHRFLMRVKGFGKRILQIREALKETMERHPSFRVVMVPFTADNDVPDMMHVVIKTASLPASWCTESEPVDENDLLPMSRDLKNLPTVGPGKPGFRIQISPIKDTNDAALLLMIHHQIMDGLTTNIFMSNFRAVLLSEQHKLSYPVPNRVFADLYRAHKGSLKGQRSLAHQKKKLEALPTSDEAFWPPLKDPAMLIGNEYDWKPTTSSARTSTDESIGRPRGTPVVLRKPIVGLTTLKQSYSIDASVIAKSAVALFNSWQTSQPMAIFANLEAARTWPFLEPILEAQLPSPLNIDGGLITHNPNIIHVNRETRALDFLSKIAAEQKIDTRHAQAPWASIFASLSQTERHWLDQATRRQIFNWLPISNNDVSTDHVELLNYHSWNDRAAQWNFSMIDRDLIQCSFLFDDVQLTEAQATQAVEKVLQIADWLATEENLQESVAKVMC